MPKVGITGSRAWENKLKIKNIIFLLKNKHTSSLDIISGGLDEGVDLYVKKFCMEFEIDYQEAKPNHFGWNHFCIEPAYMYNKPFKANNFYIRNTKLIKESDVILLFLSKDDTSPVMKDIIKQCVKKNKKLLIIEE